MSKDLRICGVDTIKQAEIKEKNIQRLFLMKEELLEAKVCSRNIIKGINIWPVSFVR